MPDWARELRARLAPLQLDAAREAEIIDELSQHLDDRVRELTAGGVEPDVAEALTLADIPDHHRLARSLAPIRRPSPRPRPIGAPATPPWSGWRADLRDAWRAIRRTPLQTATIVSSLTIGSTLTVLMFGVVNAMSSGSVPGILEPDRLVRPLIEQQGDPRARGLTMGAYRRFPDTVPGLAAVGAELPWRFSASIAGQAVAAEGMFVTGTYFSVLGTQPVLGRLVHPADDRPGAPPIVVIGYEVWLRHFGADRAAVGTSIRIGTGTYTVVGVLPPQFVGIDEGDFGETSDERSQLWLPMREMWGYPDYLAARVDRAVGPRIVGRLAAGLDRAEAERQAQAIVPVLAAAGTPGPVPGRVQLQAFSLLPVSDPVETALLISVVMIVPFIVLAIACANVAGIQLARAAGRTHDVAIRMSLGASRLRVARLVAAETGLMALASSLLAWGLATQTLRFAGNILPFAVVVDVRVFVFAMVLTVGITLVAGFAPAWRATGVDILSGLRLSARVGRVTDPKLRRVVVVGQVALSALLLVVAGLLARSIASLGSAIGPMDERVLVADVTLGDLGLDAERARQVRYTVSDAVARLPGVVETAASTSSGLFSGGAALCSADPDSRDIGSGSIGVAVTPEFFGTLGVSLRLGRALAPGDDKSVVVVNEAFLSRLPDRASGIGSIVGVTSLDGSRSSWRAEVVGVVADSYERQPRGVPRPRCYLPMDPAWAGGFTVFARSQSRSASALAPDVQRILGQVDPRLSAREIGTIAELVRVRYRWLYWVTDAVTAVSVSALVLSAVGLFALMAYFVSQRTNEFGVRLVLGAHPWMVASDVVKDALAVTLTGTAAGLLAAIPVAAVLGDGLLSTISWADPVAPAAVAALLVGVALVATLAPAWRVFRIDPVDALRQE
jgi:predicted permease